MRDNYKAWEISLSDFELQKTLDAQLKFLVNFGVLAPSSHNSQPWQFLIQDTSILVKADFSRRLQESDKNNRQLFISLGCAIANILIAADYFGFDTEPVYFPSIGNDQVVVKIVTKKLRQKQQNQEHPIFSILSRTNNRNKYDSRFPDAQFLSHIQQLENKSLKIDFLSGKEKENVADVALKSTLTAMADDHFRSELSLYVRSNLTKSKIGMPGFGLGFPTPISFFASFMLRHFNMSKLSYKQDEALLKKFTPLIGVISTQLDDKLSWVKAGEIYENIALISEQNNIKTAVWAAPIQIENYYQEIQKILETDFRPQVFFRIGYTEKLVLHSTRLLVSEVTTIL